MQLTKSDYEPLIDAVDILYKHRDKLNAEEKRFLFRAMNSVDSIYMKKEAENERVNNYNKERRRRRKQNTI